MSILIACPGCSSKFKVADVAAGKRVKCKSCGGPIPVPEHRDVEIRVIEDEEDLAAAATARVATAAAAPGKAAVTAPPPPPPRRKPQMPMPAPPPPSDPPSWDDLQDSAGPADIFSAGIASLAPPPVPSYAPTVAAFPAGRGATMAYRPARQRGGAVRPSTAAPEGFSPLLLLVFILGSVIELIAVSFRLPDGNAVKVLWTFGVTLIVMFFLVMAPLTWGGVWAASKAMRFELAPPSYLKAGAVAALPMLMVMSLQVLPANPVLSITMILAVIPVTYFITKLLFALLPGEAFLSFFLGAIGWVIGVFAALFFSALVVAGMAIGKHQTTASHGNPSFNPSLPGSDSSGGNDPSPSDGSRSRMPRFDAVSAQLDALKSETGNTGLYLTSTSRESMTDRAAGYKSRLDELSPQATTDAQKALLNDAAAAVADLQAKALTLPSERPEKIIFKPITETASFGTALTDDDSAAPASFRDYRLDIPKDLGIDLASVEDSPEGLNWHTNARGMSEAKLNIAAQPRRNPTQQRPWVKTKAFMSSDDKTLLEIDAATTQVDVSYGTLNGLPATRVAQVPADTSTSTGRFRAVATRWTKYVVADGPSWVILTCVAPADDSRTMQSLEESARSVRPAKPGEPRVDPFTPDAVVAHLDDEHADALIRRMGHTAEPALLAKLNEENFSHKDKVIRLLGDVGTKQSVLPLMVIAKADDWQLAPLARAAVKKISPADMDDANEAILSLQSRRGGISKDDALRKLAAFTPKADDPRKAGVSAMLTDMLKDFGAMFNTDPGLVGDALAVWQTPATIPSLLPLLDQDPQLSNSRKSVMIALAHTKDKRAVFPICRWLIDDSENAQTALIAMGPVAENDVDKILDNKEGKARLGAVRILTETGTAKSLKPLENFVYYNKDAMSVTLGNSAIATIKERIAHPPVAPAPGKASTPDSTSAPSNPNDPNSVLFGPPTTPTPPVRPRRAPRVPTAPQ